MHKKGCNKDIPNKDVNTHKLELTVCTLTSYSLFHSLCRSTEPKRQHCVTAQTLTDNTAYINKICMWIICMKN
uniref:Uncharacterized protein n=1 Tax=Anguilla anguilla TaxID=7936 RepID=A0A0E9WV15_ANGAN